MPTLRSTMPTITLPANLNVKAEQPDSCSESMVSPKNVFLVCSNKIHWMLCRHVVFLRQNVLVRLAQLFSFGRQRHSSLNLVHQLKSSSDSFVIISVRWKHKTNIYIFITYRTNNSCHMIKMNCEDVLSLTKIKDKNVLSVYINLSISNTFDNSQQNKPI